MLGSGQLLRLGPRWGSPEQAPPTPTVGLLCLRPGRPLSAHLAPLAPLPSSRSRLMLMGAYTDLPPSSARSIELACVLLHSCRISLRKSQLRPTCTTASCWTGSVAHM